MIVITNKSRPLPRSAIVARIHHCYADGIALVQVLLSLTDEKPDDHEGAIKHKLRKEGGTDLNPHPTAMLMPGDALVVMKRSARATATL